MTPPTISSTPSTMSTVWFAAACRIVVAAVTMVMWKSEVPMTTLVGICRM
jgi:hypothetical protein